MARTLENIYDWMRFIVHKERGVFLKTADAMRNLDTAQLDAFEQYFAPYGQTQIIHDALRPFRVDDYSFTSDINGNVAFSPNYLHMVGNPVKTISGVDYEIFFYNEDEFPKALKSQLRPVAVTSPIAKNKSTGFSIYPQGIQSGKYTYLKRPATPVYAFIQNGHQILYDGGNSTQLEWADVYINNIIAKALKFSSVNMSEEDIYKFADQYEKETA